MADEIYPTSSPNPVAALGYDGTDFRALTVDTDGNIQTDIVTVAEGSGLATETTLAAILTELGQKLETADLSLEDVTKYLNVVVKVCALPTGASTSAKQDTMITSLQLLDDLVTALGSIATDSLIVQPGKYDTAPMPLTVDADGHTQVDVLTSALPTGAATQATLASILTVLGNKLEAGDLSIEAVTKYLDVVVKESALPTGAATSAKQDTMITALQLIDDLRAALASVATDQLRVKGQDQLFSYKDQVLIQVSTAATAAVMILTTDSVPAGEVWVITSASIRNVVRAAPATMLGIKADGDTYYGAAGGSTAAAAAYFCFSGHLYLEAGNRMFGYVNGCEVNDTIQFNVNGYKMTKEA